MREKLKKFIESNKSAAVLIADIAVNIIFIVVLVVVIRTYLISPFQVYGPSMCDSMNFINERCERGYGEYIIVNKTVYQNFFGWKVGNPDRGDIIVFRPPENQDEFLIKRVIGLPGETVTIKNGKVYISNGEHPAGFELKETYLNSINEDNTHPLIDKSVFEVPADHYFVMGDNRVLSVDGRSCFKDPIASRDCGKSNNSPFITQKNIEGKAWLVLWPISKLAVLQNPKYEIPEQKLSPALLQ